MLLFVCCVEMEKELWEAVRSSDTWLVTRLLKLGVDVNSTRAACGVCVVSYNVCIGC